MAISRFFCFLCNVLWTICWHYKILIFDVSLDINGQLRQKVKKVAYTIKTLPEAKRFMFLSCLPFSFRKTGIGLKLFFGQNVRYGSSVTFRIGVASHFYKISTTMSHSVFIFVSNASQLNKLVNYIIIN